MRCRGLPRRSSSQRGWLGCAFDELLAGRPSDQAKPSPAWPYDLVLAGPERAVTGECSFTRPSAARREEHSRPQPQEQLLGVITIWKTKVEPFSDRQIALVESFADQAVIAIENVRLFKELETRTSELTRSVARLTAPRRSEQLLNNSAA